MATRAGISSRLGQQLLSLRIGQRLCKKGDKSSITVPLRVLVDAGRGILRIPGLFFFLGDRRRRNQVKGFPVRRNQRLLGQNEVRADVVQKLALVVGRSLHEAVVGRLGEFIELAVQRARIIVVNDDLDFGAVVAYDRTTIQVPVVLLPLLTSYDVDVVRHLARDHDVSVYSNDPVADALSDLAMFSPIPEKLYGAVAELLVLDERQRQRAAEV